MLKKMFFFSFIAVFFGLSITGCQKSTSTPRFSRGNSISKKSDGISGSEKEKPKIVESGYRIVDSYGSKSIEYAGTIENPNKDCGLRFPKVTIIAKNKDGSILSSNEHILDPIAPLDKISFADTGDCKEKTPASVEFKVDCKTFTSPNDKDIVPTNQIKISNISETSENGNEYSYTGEIENKSDSDLRNITLIILFKKDNKIVGGKASEIDDLEAGEKTTFDTLKEDVPKHDEYQISASSWLKD